MCLSWVCQHPWGLSGTIQTRCKSDIAMISLFLCCSLPLACLRNARCMWWDLPADRSPTKQLLHHLPGLRSLYTSWFCCRTAPIPQRCLQNRRGILSNSARSHYLQTWPKTSFFRLYLRCWLWIAHISWRCWFFVRTPDSTWASRALSACRSSGNCRSHSPRQMSQSRQSSYAAVQSANRWILNLRRIWAVLVLPRIRAPTQTATSRHWQRYLLLQ